MQRLTAMLALVFACGAAPAWASPITYQGRDTFVNYGGPFPNSDAAHGTYLGAVNVPGELVHTIDFEGAALGSFSSLVIGPGVTVSFTNQDPANSGISNANPSSLGTFDTTRPGSEYIVIQTPATRAPVNATTTLTFTFSQGVDSFGAYITGLGNDAPFNYSFNDGSGPVSLAAAGLSNGYNETQFFGFTDFGHIINSVALTLTDIPPSGANSWWYAIGIDDVTYSTPVPEPATFGMLATGLVAVVRRRAAKGRTQA